MFTFLNFSYIWCPVTSFPPDISYKLIDRFTHCQLPFGPQLSSTVMEQYKNNTILTIQSRLSESQARILLDRQYQEYLLLRDHLELLGDREASDAKRFHLNKTNNSTYQISDKRTAAMPTRSNIRKIRRINSEGEFYLDEKILGVILFRMDPRICDFINFHKKIIKRLVTVPSENKFIQLVEMAITASNHAINIINGERFRYIFNHCIPNQINYLYDDLKSYYQECCNGHCLVPKDYQQAEEKVESVAGGSSTTRRTPSKERSRTPIRRGRSRTPLRSTGRSRSPIHSSRTDQGTPVKSKSPEAEADESKLIINVSENDLELTRTYLENTDRVNNKLNEEQNKNKMLTELLKQNNDTMNNVMNQIKDMNETNQHILESLINLQKGYRTQGKTLKNLRQNYSITIAQLSSLLTKNELTTNQRQDSTESEDEEDLQSGPSEEQEDETRRAIDSIILD